MPKSIPTVEERKAADRRRAAYMKRKKLLLEREESNYGKVIIMRATEKYWVAIGHSAVILAEFLAEKLNFRVPLKADRDFGLRSKEGSVTIVNLDIYRQRLSNSTYTKLSFEDGNFLVFDLKTPFEEDEYKLLAERVLKKKAELDSRVK